MDLRTRQVVPNVSASPAQPPECMTIRAVRTELCVGHVTSIRHVDELTAVARMLHLEASYRSTQLGYQIGHTLAFQITSRNMASKRSACICRSDHEVVVQVIMPYMCTANLMKCTVAQFKEDSTH
jgi:hypothetical protein